MSRRKTATDDARAYTDFGTTTVDLAKRSDGRWEATQPGLDVIGTGDSAARATEDMARQIAKLKETGKL